MKMLVCGGRDYTDVNAVYAALRRFKFGVSAVDVLICGAATGADTIAMQYAGEYGIDIIACPAKWKVYGKRAGYVRNKEMLLHQPNFVLAFPGGKGTKMMIDLALKERLPVCQVGRDPLGEVVMGTLGTSSQIGVPGIKTPLFQKKYVERIQQYQMLTAGQRDGIYREVLMEEFAWLQQQQQAALEYDEISRGQDIMDELNGINGKTS